MPTLILAHKGSLLLGLKIAGLLLGSLLVLPVLDVRVQSRQNDCFATVLLGVGQTATGIS